MNRAEKRRQEKLSGRVSKKALEESHEKISYFFSEAVKYHQSGQLEKAQVLYKKIIKIRPDLPELHSNLGSIQHVLGDNIAAERSLRQAIALNPNYADSHSNLGNVLKEFERLDEAETSYRKAIAIKPDFAEAYSNLGITLQELGRLDEAKASCEQAIALKPDYVKAYNNLGLTLHQLGRIEESEISYRRAIALEPDYAEAHSNLGNTLRDLDKLKEAEASYRHAIVLKPNYVKAHSNLGVTLQELGRSEEAIESYKQALKINPDNDLVYHNLGIVLNGIKFKKPMPDFIEIVCNLLERKNFVRPVDISLAAISLLKFDPIIKGALKIQATGMLEPLLLQTVSSLSNVPLLLKLMEICPLPDLALESIFKDIRKAVLLNISDLKVNTEILKFQIALALQCFTNEYLYDQSDIETEAFIELESLVEKKLINGKQPSPNEIACLASYKPLNKNSWVQYLQIPVKLKGLQRRQILEPEAEKRLRIEIPIHKELTNNVSFKVREQYEQNPYPRWVKLGLPLAPKSISTYTKELKLKIPNLSINEVRAPKILIAGCGTGNHSITTSSMFKNCDVLAIDLSLSSLAYAKRMTEELGISNIKYMQADILNLEKQSRSFDIIESVGVLHHMDDPMAGWKILTNCLNPGGIMRIGLYSALAREHIVQLRDEIKRSNIGSSETAMRSFRNQVISLKNENHKTIEQTSDFYSMSMLRDLLFHVQEHQFTIPQIKDGLADLGLFFCGFKTEHNLQYFKSRGLSKSAVYDLDKWDKFEKANPHTFGSMYQFWCQKV
mgnify:CR=1 FL=1